MLIVPVLHLLRSYWPTIRNEWAQLLAYGAVSITGMSGFYFLSIQYISVPVAILIYMFAPVAVVLWVWLRTGNRPPALTFVGIAIALAGIVVLLDPWGSEINLLGIVYALAGMLCFVMFILVTANSQSQLPQMMYTALGLWVGSLTVGILNITGIMPFTFATRDVTMGSAQVSWLLPAILLVLFTTAAFYFSILGYPMIDPALGSFLSFAEVPFAILVVWWLNGEAPTVALLIGSALVVLGIVFVKWGDIQAVRARRRRLAEIADPDAG